MADLLIRDLAPELIAALDSKAMSLGLSRVEYVRRTLSRDASISNESVTEKHLSDMMDLLSDLADPEVMKGAWN